MGTTQMNDEHAQILLEEVRQMRKLLELLAEPSIAQRDAKLRDELRKIVGSSLKKQQSVLLMDGSVRTLSSNTSATTWVRALVPNDGFTLGNDW